VLRKFLGELNLEDVMI
jgi:hypothetical protein